MFFISWEIFLLTSVGSGTVVDFIQSPNFFSTKSHIFTNKLPFSNFTLSQFTLVVLGLSLVALTWFILFSSRTSSAHLRLCLLGSILTLYLFLNCSVGLYLLIYHLVQPIHGTSFTIIIPTIPYLFTTSDYINCITIYLLGFACSSTSTA